jgi:VCBS repeat-containing protein
MGEEGSAPPPWTGLEEIEARILFDASPLGGDLSIDPGVTSPNAGPLAAIREEAPGAALREEVRQELVLIDGGIRDLEVLLDGIPGSREEGRAVEVVALDPGRSGIEQISEALAGRRGLDAVHIVAHAIPGALRIGGSSIELDDLAASEDAVRAWGESLTPGADILLYGCDLAAGEEGRELVRAVARWTGADVAASTDRTGAAGLGGNWILEMRTGEVETPVVIGRETQEEWAGTLDEAASLWLSTSGDVPGPSGTPGISSWTEGEVLRFSNPGLTFEPGTTGGTFSSIINFDGFAVDGNVDIDAIHLVGSEITVGGAHAVDLQPGDLLFSTADNETLNTGIDTLVALDEDIILFRPDTPGDYSSGTFSKLLGNLAPLFGVDNLWALSLIERDTVVGDVTLQAGDFLFAREGGEEDNDIYVFHTVDVGATTTSGTVEVLVEGNDIGLTDKVFGIELIESDTTLSNITIEAGTILLTIDNSDDSIGTNAISVTRNDIFGLQFGATTLGSGTASATGLLVFQGLDVGLDGNEEAIDALALDTVENDGPVLAANAGITVAEDGSGTITAAMLQVTDPDTDADSIIYTLASLPDHGELTLDGAHLGSGGTFSQADIDAGLLAYTHEGDEDPTDSFSFTVSDGSGGSIAETTFSITITAQNDSPVLVTNAGITVVEGHFGTIETANLQVADPDDDAASIVYTLASLPAHGELSLGGTTLGAGDSFTQDDVDTGRFVSIHDGSVTTTDSFSFTVSDGDGGAIAETTFSITIRSDAPVLTTNAGLSIDEGGSGAIGASKLAVEDPDNAAASIVYTIASLPAHGSLTLDGTPLGAGGTFTQTDINSGRLAYTHDGGEATSDSFSFTVSDGEGHSIAETAFSIAVAARNDPPVLAANASLTVDEGGSAAITAAKLQVTDPDAAAASIIYTIASLPAHGSLTLDGTPLGPGDTFTQADIDSGDLAYVHDGGEDASDSFTFTVSDGSGGSIAGTAFSIAVTAQNDSPVLATNLRLSVAGNASGTITADLLRASDPDTPAASIIYTLASLPAHGALTLRGTPLGSGDEFSQADIDSGDLAYTQDGDPYAEDSFEFTIRDPEGSVPGPSVFRILVLLDDSSPESTGPETSSPPLDSPPQPAPETSEEPESQESSDGQLPFPDDAAMEVALVQPASRPEGMRTIAPDTGKPSAVAPDGGDGEVLPAEEGWTAPPASDRGLSQVQATAQEAAETTAASLQLITEEDGLWKDLNSMQKEFRSEADHENLIVGGASLVTATLSAGYFLLTARAGYLLSILLSSLPAWRMVDPLPILDRFIDDPERGQKDSDSLASLIEKAEKKAAEGPPEPRKPGGSLWRRRSQTR